MTIGAFPFTLTNGSTEDATQVMADFNLLRNFILASVGDPGTAFTLFTPTVTSGTGTGLVLGTNTQYYKLMGKILLFRGFFGITTNGTAASNLVVTLPFNSTTNGTGSAGLAWAGIALGALCDGRVGVSLTPATITIAKYDGTYPGANGVNITYGGWIETA